jgi:anti-sigma regulatory factor (Ser/Thr protein kinase)
MSDAGRGGVRRTLADFSLPSQPGNEREAVELVAEAVGELGLPPARLYRLRTAVTEATMNAVEHGNRYRMEVPVTVRVLASPEELSILITDRGDSPIPADAGAPDLEAKLEGLQAPRGLGAAPDPEASKGS